MLVAGGLAARGHDVVLVTLVDPAARDFYPVPPRVRRVALDMGWHSATPLAALANNARRVIGLRRALASLAPRLAIAFLDDVNVLTALAATGLVPRVPVVGTQHTDPGPMPLPRPWRLLRRLVYPRLDALVSVSAGVDRAVARWVRPRRRRVIMNPLAEPESEAAGAPAPTWMEAGWKHLVAMGRLTHQKGFDLLLEVFARLAPRFPTWRLVVLGEGEDRAALEARRERLGLATRVLLPGRIETPHRVLAHGDLFVLPSRYEGFGNVIIEAMHAGLATVAFDCPSGPAEIIDHDVNGVLVPAGATDALERALASLMADEGARARLAVAGRATAARFRWDALAPQWEALVLEVASRRR